MSAELADVDLSKIPLNKPTLDYLHENNVQIPQTEYDDEGNLVESGSILAPESAYTLTEVPAGADGAAPVGDNIITKFNYNSETGEFTPVYYQVSFKQNEYGDPNGDVTLTFGWQKDEYGNIDFVQDPTSPIGQTITYKYQSSETTAPDGGSYNVEYINQVQPVTLENPDGTSSNHYQHIGGVSGVTNFENVLFQDNITNVTLNVDAGGTSYSNRKNIYVDIRGGALNNSTSIDTISGSFINNSITSNINVVGSYDSVYVYAYGGALHNSGTISTITGDFIGNSVRRGGYGFGYGGAIYNSGIIGNITGDFISNSAESFGGAIYNAENSSIGNITGDFIGNSDRAIYNRSTIGNITGNFIWNSDGAIYNAENSSIGNITGDFIGNSDRAIYNRSIISNITGNFIWNSDWAIYNAENSSIGNITGDFIGNSDRAIYNDGGTIGNITGNFIWNSDGAIYNAENSSIGNITGDFIGNSANGHGYGVGGAIYNDGGTIGDITGDFIGNSATDTYSSGGGGAIYNDGGTIGNITGDFISNSTKGPSYTEGGAIFNEYGIIGDITGDFIENSTDYDGGAIYNAGNSSIGDITGNFIGNSAGYEGGAIFNHYNTTIGNITGDFIGNSAGRVGGAIYNAENSSIGNITGDFIENSAVNSGGAIYNNNSTIGNITGNFIGNSAYGGGAIALWGSSDYEWNSTNTSITDSLFRANIATNEGGAIVIDELYYNHVPLYGTLADSVSIKNSSFENNKAQRGGAISFTKDVSPTMPGPASLLPDDTGVELYDGADYTEPQMPEYNLVIDNSSFKNNLAETVDNIDAHGGAIDFKGISANPEDYGISIGEQTTYSNIVFNVVDEDGNVIETVFDGYGIIPNSSGGSGGSLPITSDPMKNIIKNSYFENNKAISENNAYGGAISLTSTGSFLSNNFVEGEKVVQNINISDRPDWMTEEEFIQEMKEEFNVPDDELAASGIFKNLETLKETYASRNSLELVNTSFVNNTAETTGADKEAHGGAIFSQTNLKITADNGISLFDNNKVIVNGNTDNEAIYMNNINPDGSELQLNIEAKNNGIVQFNDKISGDKPYDLNVDGDSSSKVIFNDDVKNANITLGKTNVYLGKDTAFDQSNSLTINTELYSMINDYAGVSNLNSLVLKSDTDFTADVDLANKEMDRFTAGSYDIQNDAKLHVIGMNLLSDANTEDDVTAIYFAEPDLKNNVLNGTGELPDSYQTAYTPIYKYNVSYDNENQYDGKGDGGYFLFTRGDKIIYPNGGGTGTTGNPSDAFNPAVLATPVGNLAAGQAAMNEAFKYVFEHADAFTQLPSMERYAKINANKYALSTDFNENMPSYADQLHNNAVWFRPYTTFETMNIKNGPKVDAITYGSLVGFDGDFKEMKNGWSRIFTGYAGYMGSSLNYSGVDTTMNGGLLGFTETFYKGNFWTAITASAGASVGESHTMYGKEDYTSLLAGVGSKTGYNFEFKDGKFIIQPIMFLSYTFVNTFDYKNAAGVSIESDPLHTIQLNPSVRFIANLKGGWQPYASVGMVWNLMNESKVTANNVKLPEMSVKPYVEYGVGVQRNWADKFTAFLQAMIRNGGRNGVALTGGFRFMLGSEPKNSDKPKVKKEIKSL